MDRGMGTQDARPHSGVFFNFKKDILTPAATWMNVEDKSCVTHSHEVPRGVRVTETGSGWWCWGWGRGREGVFPEDRVSAWDDGKSPGDDSDDGGTTV